MAHVQANIVACLWQTCEFQWDLMSLACVCVSVHLAVWPCRLAAIFTSDL